MNEFRRRMSLKGKTKYDRAYNNKVKTFERWFENTLTRQEVIIGNNKYEAVIQDQNISNNDGLSDDKYMILRNGVNCATGDLVSWKDNDWLVFSKEIKTIDTHQQFSLKPTNYTVKWMMDNGQVSNLGKGHRGYVKNNTLYTLGVAMSGANAWVTNAKYAMFLPYNNETANMKIGQRLFLGTHVFQVMMLDIISRKGLIYYLLEEDFYNPNIDDLENGVADMWKVKDEVGSDLEDNNQDNNVETPLYTMSITGNDNIKIGRASKFTISFVHADGSQVQSSVTEWIVTDIDNVSTVESKDEQSLTLRVASNFSYVDKQVTIVAKSIDGIIASKTINVISPY